MTATRDFILDKALVLDTGCMHVPGARLPLFFVQGVGEWLAIVCLSAKKMMYNMLEVHTAGHIPPLLCCIK